MTEIFRGITENRLALAAFTCGCSIIATLFVNRILSRFCKITYFAQCQKIGVTATDQLHGAVTVSWQGEPQPNLYLATATVENTSHKDLTNVDISLYCHQNTSLLTHQSAIEDTLSIPMLTNGFLELSRSSPEIAKTRRDFKIEIFNRGQTARFTFLCTTTNDAMSPEVYVNIQHEGVKLVKQDRPGYFISEVLGVPLQTCFALGLPVAASISVIFVVACGASWWIGPAVIIPGFFTMQIGALTHRTYVRARRLIQGR